MLPLFCYIDCVYRSYAVTREAKIITKIQFQRLEQRTLLIPRNQFVCVQARDQLVTDEFADVYCYIKSQRSTSYFHNQHNLLTSASVQVEHSGLTH